LRRAVEREEGGGESGKREAREKEKEEERAKGKEKETGRGGKIGGERKGVRARE